MISKMSLLYFLLISGVVYANDTIDDITQDLFDEMNVGWAQRTNNKKIVAMESSKTVIKNTQKSLPKSLPKDDELLKKNVTYQDLFENFEYYKDQRNNAHFTFDTTALIKEAELTIVNGEKISDKKGIALKIVGCSATAVAFGLIMVCPWVPPLTQQFDNNKIVQGLTSFAGYCGTAFFGAAAYIFNVDLKLRDMKLAINKEHEAILSWLKTVNKEQKK